MDDKNKVVLDGYEFELMDYVSIEGTTTITVCVSGNGEHARDLSGWILEVCPDEAQKFKDQVNILSCEKRRRSSAWVPAAAQKTTYELLGDIGVTGVVVNEWVGKYAEDPAVEFRITFDEEITPKPFSVALVSGEKVCRSGDKVCTADSDTDVKTGLFTPIEKTFCLYIVVPEGYKPVGACKINTSVTRKGLFLVQLNEAADSEEPPGMQLQGCVKIIASVPLKSSHACGDNVEAYACDCFEVCETIGCAQEKLEMRDITICPKKKSFDLTLLNAHCGKSVYRLDGLYVIDCKRR